MQKILLIALFVSVILLPSILNIINTNEALKDGNIEPVKKSVFVDHYLEEYKSQLGADYGAYRNHILRVISFTNHFLKIEKDFQPSDRYDELVAAALVYHDLGLWSDKSLKYLEPSVARAREDLSDEFNKKELKWIHNIIFWHHKITPFESHNAIEQAIVNAVRKADWCDATMGLVAMGMPSEHVKTILQAIPNQGFHLILLQFGPRIRGWDIFTAVKELSSIFKY